MNLLLLVAFLVTWLAAGLFFGLWWGERGRRLDLLHHLGREAREAGGPEGPVSRKVMHPDEAAFDAAEVNAVADALLDEAKAGGKEVSEEEALREARRLIHVGYARAGRVE